MIETKYGLKYSMPHSLVHIVDNSQYSGQLPVVTAEDPSLLASIVVTGAPMGADNKMITINRSDVLGVAYSMANLSSDDIKRYGQGVTYAGSLIEQGSPVRFMRVTPEDSTYAISALVVQWRIDGTDNKLHVRFKVKEWPEDLQRDRFKNTARVNEALIKYFKVDNAETDAQGTWTQRAFINFIGAGRGSVYNYMANAINQTNQPKRPANVRYEFDTIDTRTNQVVERFFASLINVNNKNRVDAIDPVNTVIAKRLEGSSIVVPYVNDAAVRELYDLYMSHFKNMLDIVEADEFVSNAYKAMNINIFDMIFGNYIYNGTDSTVKMPFYKVDMLETDIPALDDDRRLCVLNDTVKVGDVDKSLWDKNDPVVLYNKLLESTYGITREKDTVHVGDIYLSTSGGSTSSPKLSIISSINQYTGTVTSVTFPKVFALDGNPTAGEPWKGLRSDKSIPISTVIDDITDGQSDNARSKTVEKYINANTLVDGAVIAAYRYDPTTNTQLQGFELYTVEVKTIENPLTNQIEKDYVLHWMDPGFYYQMIDRESHPGGILGTGNAIGFWYTSEKYSQTDAAWNRPGALVVTVESDETKPSGKVNRIFVNNYERTNADKSDTANRIPVTDVAIYGIIGTPPTSVNLTEDLMGSQFDVQVFANANIENWKTTAVEIQPNAPTTFSVDDQFYLAIAANANGIEPGSALDPEKYVVQTAAERFVTYYVEKYTSDNFRTTAPDDWASNWANYDRYYTDTKKIDKVQLTTYVKLTASEAPSDWGTESETYPYTSTKYFTDAEGTIPVVFESDTDPVYAADTFYVKTLVPDSAPEFSEDLKVLGTNMDAEWNNNKNSYTDIIDTTNCKTIVTVTEVNERGEITGIALNKGVSYQNDGEASILTVLANNMNGRMIEAVYIPNSKSSSKDEPANRPKFKLINFKVTDEAATPSQIQRYTITGSLGTLFKVQADLTSIPANYYSPSYGINPSSEVGGMRLSGGYTGFFDDPDISDIEFKWRYSALLVKAFRGQLDPRIQSPTRCPAKFLFDAGYNTIVGSTILPYLTYTPADIINASIIFNDDEKEEILYNPDLISGLKYEDIDVKQAMYDLMIYRIYQGMPEDMRPIGPGSGLSLHLDSGVTDANTAMLVNTSFSKRFNNPNASWDIGGWVDVETGMSYTFTKQIVDNLIRHCREISINKPYTGKYSAISPDRYVSYFPDVDTSDWELRELLYNSGGNAWIMGQDGSLTRRSQRTLLRNAATSDLLQESNMRTLSQLTYLLQNKIDDSLLEYNDDAVIKTISDECNNIFSNWAGNLVDDLSITFARDINVDGGEILVCYCTVIFRGLILRVPIIVNVNRREYNS